MDGKTSVLSLVKIVSAEKTVSYVFTSCTVREDYVVMDTNMTNRSILKWFTKRLEPAIPVF